MTTINQTFSPCRFASYMQKSWGENRRRLLLYAAIAIAALVSIDIIAVIFSLDTARNLMETNPDALGRDFIYHPIRSTLEDWFMFLSAATLVVASSMMFSRCATKEGKLRDLLCPASPLEKYLASFLIYIIGGWLVVGIMYLFSYHILPAAMDALTPYGAFYRMESLIGPANKFDGNTRWITVIITALLFLQSFFALGSSVWPKASYFKTFGAGFLLFGSMLLITALLMLHFVRKYQLYHGCYPDWITGTTLYLTIAGVMIVVNYALAYMRYREMDVINKW